MGLYLYGCYTPKKNVQVMLPSGKIVEACMYRYITKPYWDKWNKDLVSLDGESSWGNEWGYAGKMTRMKVAKIQKLWEGVERPRHTIHVMDSQWQKEHGLGQPIEGDISYSTKDTPPIWLEENHGDINMGRVCRTRGGLWVMDVWGTGFGGDPAVYGPKMREAYESSVAKIEGIDRTPPRDIIDIQEEQRP